MNCNRRHEAAPSIMHFNHSNPLIGSNWYETVSTCITGMYCLVTPFFVNFQLSYRTLQINQLNWFTFLTLKFCNIPFKKMYTFIDCKIYILSLLNFSCLVSFKKMVILSDFYWFHKLLRLWALKKYPMKS